MDITDKELVTHLLGIYPMSEIIKQLAEKQKHEFQSSYEMQDNSDYALEAAQVYHILSETFNKLIKLES